MAVWVASGELVYRLGGWEAVVLALRGVHLDQCEKVSLTEEAVGPTGRDE